MDSEIIYLAPSEWVLLKVITIGRDTAVNSMGEPTAVHLKMRDSGPQKYEDSLIEANDAGRLKMLSQNKDLVIVYTRPNRATTQVTVYVLKRSDLLSVPMWS